VTSEPTSGIERASDACLRCGSPLESMGVEMFRTRGITGGWKMLIGELGELGEAVIPLEILECGRCRRVEFRLPVRD
jgi:hypothetical protein